MRTIFRSDGPDPTGPSPWRPTPPSGGDHPGEPSIDPATEDTTVWPEPLAAAPSQPAVGDQAPAPSAPSVSPPAPSAWGASSAGPGLPPPPVQGPGALPPPPLQPAPPAIMPWAPPPNTYANAVPGASSLVYGRTFDRVVAWWLDGLIVAIPALVVSFFLGGGIAALGGGFRVGVLVAQVVAVGIHLLYFVGFWTGGARATIGMRLLKLQIGDAQTGATLTVQQGLVRWLVIGGAFQLVELVPGLAGVGGLLALLWACALLVSTATSPTRQGLHDRAADSAIVQPAGASNAAMACLVIILLLVVVAVVSTAALIYLGVQASSILSSVGTSV